MALIPIIVAGGVCIYADPTDSSGISIGNSGGSVTNLEGFISGVQDVGKGMIAWTQDLGPNAGYYQMRITPSEVGASVSSFQFGTTAYSNVTGSRLNQVYSCGWNMAAGGGGVVIAGEPAMGLGFESHYAPGGGGPYMEHHTYYVTAAGVQRRPMTWLFNKTTGEVQGVMSGDRLTFQVDAGSLQTMVIQHGVSPVTITLGRYGQLPVVLQNEYTDTPFLQQNSSSAYVEICRVNAAGEVIIANGGATTRIGGGLRHKTLAVSNLSGGGNIGTAAATVDLYSSFDVSQTTAGQTLTIPSPTLATTGLEVSVSNTGSQAFTMLSTSLPTGNSLRAKWTGAAWSKFI